MSERSDLAAWKDVIVGAVSAIGDFDDQWDELQARELRALRTVEKLVLTNERLMVGIAQLQGALALAQAQPLPVATREGRPVPEPSNVVEFPKRPNKPDDEGPEVS